MAKRKTKVQLQEELDMWKRIAYIYISRNMYPDSGNTEELKDLSTGYFIYSKEQMLHFPSINDYKKSSYFTKGIVTLIEQNE